ncbi:(2Fe-2S)-binding protein [Actinocorallia aurantiaca]|uniref:Ferric siderophore reductase C-terminal domain-containing protein n=1 Tax=Actinocorallia aurantiaca TaxID=46204 RepID=A0ABP6H7V7_9ACTN
MTATEVGPYSPSGTDPTLLPLISLIEAASATGGIPSIAPGLRLDEGMTVRELATAPYTVLGELIEETAAQWNAPRHVAATLWWKGFSYWSTAPIALGWALNGFFPALTADNTLVQRLSGEPRFVVGTRDLVPATDVRATLLDLHTPLIDALAKTARAGRRNLWGSVAESLTHPLSVFAELLPGTPDAAALLALAGAPVSGLMELNPARRRTCCLWATLPDAEACATCCLN